VTGADGACGVGEAGGWCGAAGAEGAVWIDGVCEETGRCLGLEGVELAVGGFPCEMGGERETGR
jgi:hypothetical protein